MRTEDFIRDFTKLAKNITEEQKLLAVNILKAIDNVPNRYENGCMCPHCGKSHIRKFGKARGKQRFLCIDCSKTFSENTKTVFYSTKKSIELWLSYIELMMTGLSLAKIAQKLGISVLTAFVWRHKILKAIKKHQANTVVGGIIEADETFWLESHKGIKVEGKKSRKRGGVSHFRGLSHEQVGVLVAIDRDKNIISKVYGRGKISKAQIDKVLGGLVEPKSKMITDSCRAYIKFAKENDIKLVQIPAGKRSLGEHHINNVNSYHSGLKNFIRKFNGISTKYIENYLNWFKWIKSKNDNMLLIKECLFNI